jgi:RHS repeat-associated protein
VTGRRSLQAVVNAKGEVVARNLSTDPYGSGDVPLLGPAVDRISMDVTKDKNGDLTQVVVKVHATESLQPSTVAAGARLAVVDASGAPVFSAAAPEADPADSYGLRWTLPAADWNALTTAATATGTSLSIAVTNTLRASSWSTDVPVLPAPEWATATRPIRSSAALPVELRESPTSLSTIITSAPGDGTHTSTLYEIETLALAASGGAGESFFEDVLSARFQALPFAEPVTGLVYVRTRWYEPSTGTFLSPDPMGYQDSSNLYTFAGGDPVNRRDPTGTFAIETAVATTAATAGTAAAGAAVVVVASAAATGTALWLGWELVKDVSLAEEAEQRLRETQELNRNRRGPIARPTSTPAPPVVSATGISSNRKSGRTSEPRPLPPPVPVPAPAGDGAPQREDGERHHIATWCNCIRETTGGPWTPRFREIFDAADMNIRYDRDNIVVVKNHRGPHPQPYHQTVLDALLQAVRGKRPHTPEYTNAVRMALRRLATMIKTPGTPLNLYVTGGAG